MSDYYVATYCIENSIRKLIRETLAENIEDWWVKKVPETIQAKAKEFQDHERNTPLSRKSDDPLDYTMFKDLIEIIKDNWPEFSNRFTKNPTAIDQILFPLNELRNLIAHSGDLSELEIDRIQMLLRNWHEVQVRS